MATVVCTFFEVLANVADQLDYISPIHNVSFLVINSLAGYGCKNEEFANIIPGFNRLYPLASGYKQFAVKGASFSPKRFQSIKSGYKRFETENSLQSNCSFPKFWPTVFQFPLFLNRE
jgi:hypothetical protein